MMKRILLLMAVSLSVVFISCDGNKDEPLIHEEHDYVDLGLPSGTLWATCNVGASTPEGYGDFFAWGETVPKEFYNWDTYKWYSDNYNVMTKYLPSNPFVTPDNKIELDTLDDAAYVNWGPKWRMPTDEQMVELIENCRWRWTQINGVNGQLAIGPNGNTVFLPATGYHWMLNSKLYDEGEFGSCWSRTRSTYEPPILNGQPYGEPYAKLLGYENGRVDIFEDYRCEGLTVRAVRALQN